MLLEQQYIGLYNMRLRKSTIARHSKGEHGIWYNCYFCGFQFNKDKVKKTSNVETSVSSEVSYEIVDFLVSDDYSYLMTGDSYLIINSTTAISIVEVRSGCPFCGAELR